MPVEIVLSSCISWYSRTGLEVGMHINEAYLVQVEGWRGAVRQQAPRPAIAIYPAISVKIKILDQGTRCGVDQAARPAA